jgi:hypothetical protein
VLRAGGEESIVLNLPNIVTIHNLDSIELDGQPIAEIQRRVQTKASPVESQKTGPPHVTEG